MSLPPTSYRPFANIIEIEKNRQQSQQLVSLQARIRDVEARLPSFLNILQLTTQSATVNTSIQTSSYAMIDLTDVSLADPGADQIVFWDDSDGRFEFLVANTLLSITDNNLNVDEASIDHGSIAGLADDDHTQYAKLAGDTFVGQVNFANGTTYRIEADGDATFKNIKVLDGAFFYAGTDGDLRISHSGAVGELASHTGNLTVRSLDGYLFLSGTSHIYNDLKEIFYIRDDDDSNEVLFQLDTSARTLTIGAIDGNDDIASAFYGDFSLPTGNLLLGTTADSRMRVPYLAAVPGSVDNGSIWMEADGLHGYLAAAERNLSRPHCLDSYIDIKERQAVWNIHGGIESISTGNALDSDPTDIDDTIGLGKIIVVINAGGDVTGEITVTGTTVDRDTGAETGADTDTLTVDTLSTDNSGTDSGGNVTYAFVNAYMTSKWFKGAVTLSTTNLTLTDVDIYQCSFEQFNDLPNVTIDTFDTNQFANNASANIYWHLYSVKPSGDKVTLAKEKSMELIAADVSVNLHYRLRRGNLGISIDGTTQGFFVQCYPEPLNNIYWEDINLKIWYY